jgi:hypothetical protein
MLDYSPIRSTDAPELVAQIQELQRRGFYIRRCTEAQLKIEDVNYYFRTGKITIDGHSPLAKGGFDHLLEVLEARIKPRARR